MTSAGELIGMLFAAGIIFLLLAGLVIFTIWAVRIMRRSVGMQGKGLTAVDESLELTRRAVALSEESLRLQRQTNELLGKLVDSKASGNAP